MNKIWYCLFLIFFGISTSFAQTISKTWNFEAVEDSTQNALFEVSPGNDYLKLDDGSFELKLTQSEAPAATGNYVFQNEVLVLFHDTPADSIQNFRVTTLTDSTLVLSSRKVAYFLSEVPQTIAEVLPVETVKTMIPNEGFTFTSFWRGAIGMVSLILIAFLFSSNRKAINWKTVLVGLAAQLLLAIGVLQVEIVQNVFEGSEQ